MNFTGALAAGSRGKSHGGCVRAAGGLHSHIVMRLQSFLRDSSNGSSVTGLHVRGLRLEPSPCCVPTSEAHILPPHTHPPASLLVKLKSLYVHFQDLATLVLLPRRNSERYDDDLCVFFTSTLLISTLSVVMHLKKKIGSLN